jgi:Sulfotransferase family
VTSQDPSPLIFVGGTGRSGTHIVAELIGRHPTLHAVPIECRFHSNPKGLSEVVTGAATPSAFLTKLRRYWWHRVRLGERALVRARWRARGEGKERGLHKIIAKDDFEAAASRFEDATAGIEDGSRPEVVAASRTLFFDLLGPLRDGKPGLVEMSCFTVAAAHGLERIFPEALFIHSVRDGRDSGSSKVSKAQKSHHPSDATTGVEWWEGRLALAERGYRGLTEPSKLHAVCLDELVWGDREASYGGLRDFLGLDDDQGMRAFFDGEMNAQNAHRERWREGLGEAQQQAVIKRYEAALERIEREGYHCAALLRTNYERER